MSYVGELAATIWICYNLQIQKRIVSGETIPQFHAFIDNLNLNFQTLLLQMGIGQQRIQSGFQREWSITNLWRKYAMLPMIPWMTILKYRSALLTQHIQLRIFILKNNLWKKNVQSIFAFEWRKKEERTKWYRTNKLSLEVYY